MAGYLADQLRQSESLVQPTGIDLCAAQHFTVLFRYCAELAAATGVSQLLERLLGSQSSGHRGVGHMTFALAWAVIRLAAFEAMTEETNLWADFGGWYFSSIFIFLCWAAFYHGIKYYRLLLFERDQLLAAEALQKEEVLRRTRAETAVKESQLTLLRYQLNPHFVQHLEFDLCSD